MDNNELMHYGVPGMKWGVRRNRRTGGSRTAGKKRKNEIENLSTEELRKKVNRMNMEQRYIDLTRPPSRTSRVADGVENVSRSAGDINKVYKAYKNIKGDKDLKGKISGQAIDGVSKSARLAKKIDNTVSNKQHIKESRKKLDKMTDADLARQVDRLDLERQYSRLKESTISSGKMKATEILSIAGDVAAIGASAATIAVGIQKLRRGG